MRLKPASQSIAQLIELVNSFPVDFELKKHDTPDRTYLEVMNAVICELPASQFPLFHEWVCTTTRLYSKDPSEDDGEFCLQRCRELFEARKLLRSISAAHRQAEKLKREGDKFSIQVLVNGILADPGYWLNAAVPAVDEQGQLQFEVPSLIGGARKVDTARIRQCEICKKIFWAGRITKKCCSQPCLKVFHTRQWREKQALYEGNRYRKEQEREKQRRLK